MAKYIPIRETEIPAGVRFHIPARNQGQFVEVAYGDFGAGEADDGAPYKRVHDRTDGPTGPVRYYRLDRD